MDVRRDDDDKLSVMLSECASVPARGCMPVGLLSEVAWL